MIHLKPEMRIALLLGVGVTLFYLAFLRHHLYVIDGLSMLDVTRSLIREGEFTVSSPDIGRRGADGQYYSIWYPLLSIVAVPFVALAQLVAHAVQMPAGTVEVSAALLVPLLCTAATAAMVALVGVRLGSDMVGAWLAACGFAFGTVALEYARAFFAEPLLALLTLASLALAFRLTRPAIVLAAVLAGLAVLAKPVGIIIGPIVSGYVLLRQRSLRHAWLPVAGTGAGVALYLVYDYMRFGAVSPSPVFLISDPLLLGESLVGMLISPGRGIIWYCVPVVLALVGFWHIPRQHRLEAGALLVMSMGYLLIYTVVQRPLGNWYGGWSWGPRFLFPAVPLLLVLTSSLTGYWRRWLIGGIVVGFLINMPTLIANYELYYAAAEAQGATMQAILWSPAHLPIVHIWPSAYDQAQEALRGSLEAVAVRWWRLPGGIPNWVGVGVMGFLLVASSWCIVASYRQARRMVIIRQQ